MTKQAKVEAHLRTYKSITQAIAQKHYNSWRLAVIIQRLRDRGWQIETVKHPTADGVSHYAEYVLLAVPK